MFQTAARSVTEGMPTMPVPPWQEAFGLGMIAVLCIGMTAILFSMVLARGVLSMRRTRRDIRAERDASEIVDLGFLENLARATPPQRMGALVYAMVRDCRGRILDIREAARAGDLDRLQSESSALAHSCEAFGATKLAQHARSLFFAVRDQAFDDAGRHIVELDAVAQATFEALERRAPDYSDPAIQSN